MRLVDSHCHLDFPELAPQLPDLLAEMTRQNVVAAVCVAVRYEEQGQVLALAEAHANLWATAGVHPDYQECFEPTVDQLVELAGHPKVIAIGETGLDYYRLSGDLEWQRERFRNHIRAARMAAKPLVIHTRAAAEDTLRVMREEGAEAVGGIMHCFTESAAVAERALDLGFVISFSGILTFKSANDLRDVVRGLPLDRILVETDAPYLAPVPHRGRTNQPAFVRHVADAIAKVKGISLEEVAEATTNNFLRLFPQTRAQVLA
jgi:TatD DNase family protein